MILSRCLTIPLLSGTGGVYLTGNSTFDYLLVHALQRQRLFLRSWGQLIAWGLSYYLSLSPGSIVILHTPAAGLVWHSTLTGLRFTLEANSERYGQLFGAASPYDMHWIRWELLVGTWRETQIAGQNPVYVTILLDIVAPEHLNSRSFPVSIPCIYKHNLSTSSWHHA